VRRRSRGSGSVFYDHHAHSWVAVVSLGTRDGQRVRRKIRAPSQATARAELERLHRSYRPGSAPSSETLDRYLARWLREHTPNVGRRTAVSYAGHVERHISSLLGGILLPRLQPSDVRRLIADRLRAGISPSTVGHIVTTLRIALNQAVRDRVLVENAASAVRLPKVQREPVRPLTASEAVRIRDAVRGDPLEALYVLLMGTGMRLGEACGLDWRDIDLEAGTAFIRHGKTARSVRTVPLSAPVVLALRAHRSRRIGSEAVFLGPRSGKRLSTATVSHAFPRLLQRAGLRPMRVHDLRHGFATRAVAKDVHMRVIADILGHANPSITANTYAHVAPDDQREAADAVGSELQ